MAKIKHSTRFPFPSGAYTARPTPGKFVTQPHEFPFEYTTKAGKAPCANKKGDVPGKCRVKFGFEAGQPVLRYCPSVKDRGMLVPVNSPADAVEKSQAACQTYVQRGKFPKQPGMHLGRVGFARPRPGYPHKVSIPLSVRNVFQRRNLNPALDRRGSGYSVVNMYVSNDELNQLEDTADEILLESRSPVERKVARRWIAGRQFTPVRAVAGLKAKRKPTLAACRRSVAKAKKAKSRASAAFKRKSLTKAQRDKIFKKADRVIASCRRK